MQDNIVQDKPASHSQSQEETIAVIKAPEFLQPMEDTGPVPLSFPSILRHPGLTSRYAHLVNSTGPLVPPPGQTKKVWRRNDNEGKRWVRRRENGTSRQTIRFEFFLPNNNDICAYSSLHGQPTHRGAVKARSRASLASPPDNVSHPSPTVSPTQRASPRERHTRTRRQSQQRRTVQPLPPRHAQDTPPLWRPHRGPRPRSRGRADELARRGRCRAEPGAGRGAPVPRACRGGRGGDP